MSLFSKKDTPDSNPLKNYDKQYDIFRDQSVLDALQREIAIYGTELESNGRTPFLRLCEAKNYIKGNTTNGHYDFTVIQQAGLEAPFLDISRKENALRRLQDHRAKMNVPTESLDRDSKFEGKVEDVNF